MSLEYKILGQELVSYTDGEGEPGSSYYVSYEETQVPMFVAFGPRQMAYSQDGISWTAVDLQQAEWASVAYGDGKFVAIARFSSLSLYSTDGITWTQSSMPQSDEWTSVTFGDGKFVAISANYTTSGAYSTDGIVWNSMTMPRSSEWRSVAYGDGKFVAVANNQLAAYSTDGINWTEPSMPEQADWLSVSYGEGRFVATADRRFSGAGADNAYSTDGITWYSGQEFSNPGLWRSVTYGNGRFVAVRTVSQEAAYSTDGGIVWTQSTLPEFGNWEKVTFGDGKFLAIGSENKIAYSVDGASWTGYDLPDRPYWYAVAFGQSTQLTETLNIIGGQGTTQTEEFLPITVYTVPEGKQTTVTSIFVANHDDTDSTYDLAIMPAGEELSLKHHIRWDMAVAAKDFENISTKITMSAGDKLVIFPSTVDAVSITAFGVEK
jgi:hypothetical protein